MNNFGVIEIASTRTTSAPGWAYVPDRQQPLAIAAPSNRKRARAAASGGQLSLADANARQEAKARREIEILDRDNARDVHISIPVKNGIARTGGKKYTPNVRRILQSQKTFANHLDDYIALQAQQPAGGGEGGNNNISGGGGSRDTTTSATTAAGGNTSTRSGGQRQASISVGPASKKPSSTRQQQQAKKGEEEKEEEPEDVEMLDQSPADGPQKTDVAQKEKEKKKRSAILASYPAHPAHPEDASPLLASRLPPLPSDNELRTLLDAPALNYLEARGTWPPQSFGDREEGGQQQQQRYPTRAFCALCGYWGRVRCMKCGTRVCALDCLETHRDECITRYGL
ncbi:hypothetical protein F5Y08DRAFT_230556 [Xylaria arbuscula]|nr:hypothetical protein F5Y08DRAFT_230556 [Xylaria arbuscula]